MVVIEEAEHQMLLSLTDGHLGQDNYITHSLLILVEDTNDNIPVFTELPPSVVIQEHQHPGVIAQFRATDRDSWAIGQFGRQGQLGSIEKTLITGTGRKA